MLVLAGLLLVACQPATAPANTPEETPGPGGEIRSIDEISVDGPPQIVEIAALAHVDLRGLMAIPPPADRPGDARGWFVRLRELRDAAESRLGRRLPELSMGMTDDFEVAVEEGATLVRVGRAIFGERR